MEIFNLNDIHDKHIILIIKKDKDNYELVNDILNVINYKWGKIITKNKKFKKTHSNYKKHIKYLNNITNILHDYIYLIMDNCCDNFGWSLSKDFRNLICYDRLFFLLIMSNIFGLSFDLKSKIDYIFVFQENNKIEREKIYNNYFQSHMTYNIFNKYMNELKYTDECLVMDNKGNLFSYDI